LTRKIELAPLKFATWQLYYEDVVVKIWEIGVFVSCPDFDFFAAVASVKKHVRVKWSV
jgi:hypothetical protein